MKYYLLRADNTISDYGDYPEAPPDREDGIWQAGSPPANSQELLPLPEAFRLAFEKALPPEIQADLAMLKAAVKMELEQSRPEIAKLVIARANIPAALEPARQTLLNLFPSPNTPTD